MKIDLTIRNVPAEQQKQWDEIVRHPLQSWAWGEFRKAMGVNVARLGVYEKNKLVRCWQLTFHKIPRLPFTVGYFPKGPKPTGQMLEALRELAQKQRAIFVRIEPDTTAEEQPDDLENYDIRSAHRPLFTKYTFVLDLTKSEEKMLSGMHPKTRYNIRLATRKGVVIREDNSDAAFASYLKLSGETTQRQNFFAHNTSYHTTMWKTLRDAGIAKLFTATYNNAIVCTWIIFVWKDTVYYPYGGSSRDHKDVMAPNLILWEIALWAKKHGAYYFDLWGALGPNPDPHDPWFGFHRFKEGYAPELVEYAGSFDFVIRPVMYRMFTIADSLRWLILNRVGHN